MSRNGRPRGGVVQNAARDLLGFALERGRGKGDGLRRAVDALQVCSMKSEQPEARSRARMAPGQSGSVTVTAQRGCQLFDQAQLGRREGEESIEHDVRRQFARLGCGGFDPGVSQRHPAARRDALDKVE